jgi:putative ABC transport system substrate-binding protein
MRRREFIAGLGSAAAWPAVARAQQLALPVVGWLDGQSPEMTREFLPPFRRGLAETGYVEGRNVIVEYRWAENDNDRLSALAADLVRRHVAVIVAATTSAALAAKVSTQTIPIVFRIGSDPVTLGLVASLNRPTGNLTGVATLSGDIATKRLALLHELVPAIASIALLVNPANPSYVQAETKDLQSVVPPLPNLRNICLSNKHDNNYTVLLPVVSACMISGDCYMIAGHRSCQSARC